MCIQKSIFKCFSATSFLILSTLFLNGCGGSGPEDPSVSSSACSDTIKEEYSYLDQACGQISGTSTESQKDECQLIYQEFVSKYPSLSCNLSNGEEITEAELEEKYLDSIVSYDDEVDELFN